MHTHHWSTRSTHVTSEGLVSYQGCTCGVHRIIAAPTHPYAPLAEVATDATDR